MERILETEIDFKTKNGKKIIKFINTSIISALIYGSEIWTFIYKSKDMLNKVERNNRKDLKLNDRIRNRTGFADVTVLCLRRKFRRVAHIARREDGR